MYDILNTGAVTTDIFITSTCGDTWQQKIMRKTTKMSKHNVQAYMRYIIFHFVSNRPENEMTYCQKLVHGMMAS